VLLYEPTRSCNTSKYLNVLLAVKYLYILFLNVLLNQSTIASFVSFIAPYQFILSSFNNFENVYFWIPYLDVSDICWFSSWLFQNRDEDIIRFLSCSSFERTYLNTSSPVPSAFLSVLHSIFSIAFSIYPQTSSHNSHAAQMTYLIKFNCLLSYLATLSTFIIILSSYILTPFPPTKILIYPSF